MTEIRFYVNLQDPVGYACRLLRKAHGLGTRVVVTGDAATLALRPGRWRVVVLGPEGERAVHMRDVR